MNKSFRLLCFAASMAGLAFAAPVVHAESLFANEERMNALAQDMQGISANISSSMAETQSAIQQLLREEGNPSADAVRAYFDNLESQARTILTQVSVNSEFMDALDAADRRLQVMQRRFEADVEASGGNDARANSRLERIQRARSEFENQVKMVRQTEKDIVQLLIENSTARDDLIAEGTLRDAELVVEALSRVTGGLQAAADTLQEISSAALQRDDVSSIAPE